MKKLWKRDNLDDWIDRYCRGNKKYIFWNSLLRPKIPTLSASFVQILIFWIESSKGISVFTFFWKLILRAKMNTFYKNKCFFSKKMCFFKEKFTKPKTPQVDAFCCIFFMSKVCILRGFAIFRYNILCFYEGILHLECRSTWPQLNS